MISVPLAILLGLMSNIVVFMRVNDVLVREPVRRKNPALAALFDQVSRGVRERYHLRAAGLDPEPLDEFMRRSDAEMLVLDKTGADNLRYVREQYWYHLEFQMNMFLATAALLAALVMFSFMRHRPVWLCLERAGIEFVLLGATCWLFLTAARKNYRRHLEKICSVLAGILSAELQPPTPTPGASGGPGTGRLGASLNVVQMATLGCAILCLARR